MIRKWIIHTSTEEAGKKTLNEQALMEFQKSDNRRQVMLTNDGRCTCEIKSKIAMAKAAFSKKKTLFTSKLDLNLRKRLIKCYIWSMALYGAETWTLRAAD